MHIKISKGLEGIIARVTFDTAKAGHNHALKDFLMLEIIRTEGTLAYQILLSRLQDWEIHRIALRIEHEARSAVAIESSPEAFFRQFIEELQLSNPEAGTISTIHAMIAIVRDRSTCTSRVMEMYHLSHEQLAAAAESLTRIDLQRHRQIRRLLLDAEHSEEFESKSEEERTGEEGYHSTLSTHSTLTRPALSKFGTDLTHLASEGRIEPVIGRDAEIERVVQILSRRKKNNPVLIGEAGVGKSAIVEGLALRICAGGVPHTLASKRIFSLDVAALVAGTKFRGEFEERLQQLLDELRKSQDVILFIDEIHTIVGAGATQGSLDTANILKPALARGELRTIGATTPDEYRENIERDAALERRFQRVMVEPTTREQTMQIVRNAAPHYEQFHNVRYSEAALEACFSLAERYLTERHFPDKALDILDEAGSRAHIHSVPKSGKQQHPTLVDAAAIAKVITSMTGIPIERLTAGERKRIESLRTTLSTRIIGQEAAVERVTRAIHRSRAGLKDTKRPIGVFIFVGPTGVGKTLLAKELSRHLFDEQRGLIRLDMSEYGEKHNISRLIGSPPGYVGYGEGGQLTEAVRRHPYSVILFDEIEKAHPDIFNTMLQIFDEGHLTDGVGRRIDFRNTIIIMTSNLGSTQAAKPTRVGYATSAKATPLATEPQHDYQKALESTFSPEFLNRVDDIVIFRALSAADIGRIIELELQELSARAKTLGYNIEITPEAKSRLAERGYQKRYGARALKRTLTELVEEPLSTLIIEGRLQEGKTIIVEPGEQGLSLKVA